MAFLCCTYVAPAFDFAHRIRHGHQCEAEASRDTWHVHVVRVVVFISWALAADREIGFAVENEHRSAHPIQRLFRMDYAYISVDKGTVQYFQI